MMRASLVKTIAYYCLRNMYIYVTRNIAFIPCSDTRNPRAAPTSVMILATAACSIHFSRAHTHTHMSGRRRERQRKKKKCYVITRAH